MHCVSSTSVQREATAFVWGRSIFQSVSLSKSSPWGKRQRLLLLLFSFAAARRRCCTCADKDDTRRCYCVFSVATAQSHFDPMIAWKAASECLRREDISSKWAYFSYFFHIFEPHFSSEQGFNLEAKLWLKVGVRHIMVRFRVRVWLNKRMENVNGRYC